jgi:hypothetical protein
MRPDDSDIESRTSERAAFFSKDAMIHCAVDRGHVDDAKRSHGKVEKSGLVKIRSKFKPVAML